MRCAFDADALIYASDPARPAGHAIRELLSADTTQAYGSVLLLPEVLGKPTRLDQHADVARLADLLGRLELIEVDVPIARMAVQVSAAYGLKTVDAVHLATAAWAGADVFVTNNRRDFPADRITEVDVRYPDALLGHVS